MVLDSYLDAFDGKYGWKQYRVILSYILPHEKWCIFIWIKRGMNINNRSAAYIIESEIFKFIGKMVHKYHSKHNGLFR